MASMATQQGGLLEKRSHCNLNRPSDEARESHLRVTQAAIDRLIAEVESANDSTPLRNLESSKVISRTISTKNGEPSNLDLTIVDRHHDPLEPPRHKYKKPNPYRGDGFSLATVQTRAPVLRKKAPELTKEQKKEWQIPSGVSNWKNRHGTLVDLEQRASIPPAYNAARSQRKTDLASALSQAEQEIADKRRRELGIQNRQIALKQKLREQRDSRRDTQDTSEKDDLFDTRLFRASSSARTSSFDSTIFSDGRKKRNPIRFQK